MDLDKVSKIIVAVRSVVFSHELVDEECEHSTVCFEGMASYAPSILVDCSTKLNEYSEVMALQQELMFLILKILKSHKVELVFSKS